MHISQPIIKEVSDIDFITLEEIKHHLRVQHSSDDGLIFSMLHAATENAENFLRMHLTKKEVELVVIGNLEMEIIVNSYPINYISSFRYMHLAKEFTLKEKSEFEFDAGLEKVFLKKNYPSDRAHIIMNVGYGKNIPASIKQGIVRHIQKAYDDQSLEEIFAEITPFYQNHRRYSL
jgi:hypothetical protein